MTIKELWENSGLDSKVIADNAGISRTLLQQYIRGSKNINKCPLDIAVRLAHALNVNPEDLLVEEPPVEIVTVWMATKDASVWLLEMSDGSKWNWVINLKFATPADRGPFKGWLKYGAGSSQLLAAQAADIELRN